MNSEEYILALGLIVKATLNGMSEVQRDTMKKHIRALTLPADEPQAEYVRTCALKLIDNHGNMIVGERI